MLGEEIRRLRKEKGMTLRELASATGISHPYISQIEKRGNVPSKKVEMQILSVLKPDEYRDIRDNVWDKWDYIALLEEKRQLEVEVKRLQALLLLKDGE